MSLEIWVRPHAQHGYVMGVDTAEGLGHGDYSCAHVLDLNTGELVASWHGHIPPDALADEVLSLGLWYRDALCCVEANNHGLTTITVLRQLGYPNLFRRRSLNQATSKVSQESAMSGGRCLGLLMMIGLLLWLWRIRCVSMLMPLSMCRKLMITGLWTGLPVWLLRLTLWVMI